MNRDRNDAQSPATAAAGAGGPTLDRRERFTHGATSRSTGERPAGAGAPRTAAREGAILLPHLRPGTALLDCGCGSGSITIGFAEAVAPGPVLGIDPGPEAIDAARADAAALGLDNVRFEVASAYAVPLPAGSVDAVFFHNVLQHLGDPPAALAEAHRVLRPGGVIGVRDSDFGSTVRAPDGPLLREGMGLYLRWWQQNGGNPYVARGLRGLLRAAGFTRIASSASSWCFAAPEGAQQWGRTVARQLARDAFVEHALSSGWTDRDGLDQMVAAWQQWAIDEDAFEARIACEAVGWRA